jgi:hypothetical protein
MIVQIINQMMINYRFIIVWFLFCLVIFVFPLLIFSQEPKLRGHQEILKRPNLKYTASDFRDPFIPQMPIPQEEEAPKIERIEKKVRAKISELFSFSIQGIIWNPDKPMAIINNNVLKKGDILFMADKKGTAEEITIVDIDKDGVTIGYAGEEEKLAYPAGEETEATGKEIRTK